MLGPVGRGILKRKFNVKPSGFLRTSMTYVNHQTKTISSEKNEIFLCILFMIIYSNTSSRNPFHMVDEYTLTGFLEIRM